MKQVEIPRTASDKEDSRPVTVVEALKSESETLKDLDHPNIVSYLGFEETPTFLSMCVELSSYLTVIRVSRSVPQLFGIRTRWLDCELSPETRPFRRGGHEVVHGPDSQWSGIPSLQRYSASGMYRHDRMVDVHS